MNQNQKTLALCIATTMMLAACGGGDDADNGGGNSGTNPGTHPGTPGYNGLLDYTTISPRCPMNEGGRNASLADIECLRGVYRGTMQNDGRACEVEFLGRDGFRLTIGRNTAKIAPIAAPQVEQYRHYNNPRDTGYDFYRNYLDADVNYTYSTTGKTDQYTRVIFRLLNKQYDPEFYDYIENYMNSSINHWPECISGGHVPGVAEACIGFSDLPENVQNALNIGSKNSACIVESVTWKDKN